jgi:hypothetical protein
MSYFDYSVTKQDGTKESLKDFSGKVLLIVNTATGCGFTPQYEDLERIYAARTRASRSSTSPATSSRTRHLSPMRRSTPSAPSSSTPPFRASRSSR